MTSSSRFASAAATPDVVKISVGAYDSNAEALSRYLTVKYARDMVALIDKELERRPSGNSRDRRRWRRVWLRDRERYQAVIDKALAQLAGI